MSKREGRGRGRRVEVGDRRKGERVRLLRVGVVRERIVESEVCEVGLEGGKER